MRPLRLEMTAFGPFEHEVITFSDVQSVPLFLISGKTGSGKTTIFDAICVALYGSPSGQNRSTEDLRSHFVASDVITEVRFLFEHQGKRYEVLRQPKQEIAKKRGEGMRTMSAKASLIVYDVSGEEERHLSKINEVNQYLIKLIKLDKKQFTQFVLLPQGAFRAFLESSSDEKELILRDLFATGDYQALVDKLGERAKAMRQSHQQQIDKIEAQLALLSLTSMNDIVPAKEETELMLQSLQQTKQDLVQKKNELDQIGSAIQSLQQIKQDLALFDQLNRQLHELEQQSQSIHQAKQLIDQLTVLKHEYERYQQLQQAKANVVKLMQEQEIATEQDGRLAQQLLQVTKSYQSCCQQQEAYQQALRQQEVLEQALSQMTQSIAIKQKLDILATEQQTRQDKQATLRTQSETIQQTLVTLEDSLQLESELQLQVYQAQERLTRIDDQLKSSHDWQSTLAEYERLTQKQTAFEEQLAKQQELVAKCEQEGQSLNDQILLAEINDLAKQLSPDAPCPLCGSTIHPHPHQIDEQLPDVAQLKEERQQVQADLVTLREKLADVKAGVETTAQRLQTLKQADDQWQEKTGCQTLNQYVSVLTEHQMKQKQLLEEKLSLLARCQQAKRDKERLTQQLEALQSQQNALQTAELTCQQEMVRLEAQQAVLPDDQLKNQYEQQLQALRKEWDGYEAKRQQLEQAVNAATQARQDNKDQLTRLVAQIESQHQTIEQLQRGLEAKLSSLGLDLTAFEAIDERLNELERLETTVARYDQQQTEIKTQLKAVADVQDKEELLVELPEKQALYQQLEEELVATTEKVTKQEYYYQDRFQQLTRMAAETSQMAGQLNEIQEMQTLYEVLAGKSQHSRIGLERYVLQKTFKKVLILANQRLDRLTQHRYRLLLNESSQGSVKRSGLELEVYDEYAGVARSVSTLSGGEGFIISLALALSFGDLIQQQVGGVQIETLFIDEGFGTLDEESLDTALTALEEIESEGRVIGIISHVPELKQRIPQQIQVKMNGNGTSQIQIQTV